MMKQSLKKNLLLFRIYESISLGDLFVIIFFVPFLLAKGLSLAEILTLHAIQNGVSLLFEIPSGYLADRWQRKYALFISAIIRTGAYGLMWFGQDFGILAFAWGVAGIGSSFHSGISSAFLYDTLKEMRQEKRYAHELGLVKALGFYFFVVASLVGGYFLVINTDSPALLNCLFFTAAAVLALFLKEPLRSKETPHTSNLKNSLTLLGAPFRLHSNLFPVVLFGALFAALAQSSLFLVQYYLGLLGIAGTLFGIFMAIDYLFRGLVSQHIYHFLRPSLSVRYVLFGLGIALALGTIVPSFSVGLIFIPFFILISVARGAHTVSIDTFINKRIGSEVRATFLSAGSVAFKLLYLGIAPFFGWLTQIQGIKTSLAVLGIFSLFSLFLLMPLLKKPSENI